MRRVGLLLLDGSRAFDLSVVHEVWGIDRSNWGVPAFDLRTYGPPGIVRITGGMFARADHGLPRLGECDLVVVPGRANPGAPVAPEAIDALRQAYDGGATVASLCAGAFVLAAAGLLDGRPATTHWGMAKHLQNLHPRVVVDPNVLFLGRDRIWTSAGVTAGVDLCLHLVREAHGAQTAAGIARAMVTPPFRAGSQAQYMQRPAAPRPLDQTLSTVQERALADLSRPWSIAELARVAGMSARTFIRHFTATTGISPGAWLIAQRVDAARGLLETSDASVEDVARRCGFGSAVSLRHHFTPRLGIPPRQYRETFRGRQALRPR